jgi:1-phosphatidylinositol-4-phosphate 5-kinase
MFFLSDDEKFLVKTMRKNECETFTAMLPEYYGHIESNPDTLLTRFYGVYGIKDAGRTVSQVACGERSDLSFLGWRRLRLVLFRPD